MSRFAFPIAVVLSLASAAQWTSTPYTSSNGVFSTDWYIAHDAGNGFHVRSPFAQQWTPLSSAGATVAHLADSVFALKESASTVRAWSALTNSSSAQTMVSAFTSALTPSSSTSYCIFKDFVPDTPGGVLRAYSAYTGTWSSFTPPGFGFVQAGANVAVLQTSGQYHAYSAYTGQWTTLDAVGALPFAGSDFAAADLNASGAPFRYAAFSALRGTWSLSPAYPSSGSGLISGTGSAFAIRTDIGSATTHSYSGYSPFTGQWTTSALVHTNASSKQGAAVGNVVRIQDSNTSVRYELFGAATGAWQALTGAGLVEDSLHEDFHVVRTSEGSPKTVYAASGLVGGGYTAITVPTFITLPPIVSPGTRGCIVYGQGTPATTSAWAYSAATNAFTPPIPYPQGGGSQLVGDASVFGWILQGASSAGTSAQAYSVLANEWTSGPQVDGTNAWSLDGTGNEITLIRNEGAAGFSYHAFDAHARVWRAAPSLTTHWKAGKNAFLAYSPATGVCHGFSAERGDWTTQTGIGTITPTGVPIFRERFAWFGDSNQKLWVFTTPDRAYSWFQWPYTKTFGNSGATSGGTTPYVGVSVSGTPGTEFALVYASLALAPVPLALPGFGGLLDLDPVGAFQLASLGVFDADGVREARIPLASPIAAGTQAWMQAVLVDLGSLQASFAGRATGTRFF